MKQKRKKKQLKRKRSETNRKKNETKVPSKLKNNNNKEMKKERNLKTLQKSLNRASTEPPSSAGATGLTPSITFQQLQLCQILEQSNGEKDFKANQYQPWPPEKMNKSEKMSSERRINGK